MIEDKDDAEQIYLANYDKGWNKYKNVMTKTTEDFKTWVYSNGPKKGEL